MIGLLKARRASLALVITIFASFIWIGCGGQAPRTRPTTTVQFDTSAAWKLIEQQVAVGSRPAGSPQLRRLAERLRRALPNGTFEPIPGQPGLRNVVGTIPGRRPGIVVGAHYDTLAQPAGFVGANNGAAGTAIVVEVARALAASKPPSGASEVRFVLFDGEEPPSGLPESSDFYQTGLRGSRAYVAAYPDRTKAMVLLDYVANKHLQLPREATSTPILWSNVREAANAVGAGRFFPARTESAILDDHTPFLRTGVAAVDLIDWSYPGHDLRDSMSMLSSQSVTAVGRTVVELVSRLRSGQIRLSVW